MFRCQVVCKMTVGFLLWEIYCGFSYLFLTIPKNTKIATTKPTITKTIAPITSPIVKSTRYSAVESVVDSISSALLIELTYPKKDGNPTINKTIATIPIISLSFKNLTQAIYRCCNRINNLCQYGCYQFNKIFQFLDPKLFFLIASLPILINHKCEFYVGKFLYRRGWFTNCHLHELDSYVFTDYETFDGGGSDLKPPLSKKYFLEGI